MAKPLKPGKQAVDLAAQAARPSKIRRDPPPVVKQTIVPDREDHDRRMAAIGILAFAIAILIIILGLASYNGWSPSQVTYRM